MGNKNKHICKIFWDSNDLDKYIFWFLTYLYYLLYFGLDVSPLIIPILTTYNSFWYLCSDLVATLILFPVSVVILTI